MKLYYAPGACSLASHILMHEWQLTHSTELVDLKTHKTAKGEDFYKINPKGYVPALDLDNGSILTENIAILCYLTDLRGTPQGDKYTFLEWLAFISTELHKGIGSLFGLKNGPQEVVKAVHERIAKRLTYLDSKIKDKKYAFGAEFTAIDAYLVTVLNWCSMLNVDLSPYKNINAYLKTMFDRPSVKKAMQHEGLIK